MARSTGNVGRHDLARVPDPVSGLPGDIPTSANNTQRELTVVAVVDVYDAQRRQRALARVDFLDRERRNNRIDEASYLVGREIERVFEHMSRIGGGGQFLEGDRLDPATQAEVAALLGFERATQINAFLGWMVRRVGQRDTRLLWMVLGIRLPMPTAAVAFGQLGMWGLRYTSHRFRDALTALAEAKAAKGRGRRAPENLKPGGSRR